MLLQVKNLSKKFNDKTIIDDVSFNIKKGEIFSIIGKSGIGKSTLAKIILGIVKYDSGEILFENKDISKRKISDIQMIFQDPYSSLNECMTIFEILLEPLIVNDIPNSYKKVEEMLKLIGLYDLKDKYPFELSGGQRQRVVVGASIILRPKLVLCDEPVASLDLSIQEQILDLIRFFNRKYGITFLFISR